MTGQTHFSLGQVVATPAALQLLQFHEVPPATLLQRHSAGDWGEIAPEDHGLNDQPLVTGERLLSVYILAPGATVWIITEAIDDAGARAATTLLCPDEY